MRVIINNEKIGQNIKMLCDNNNQTLDELSISAGIAKNILIDYVTGKKQINVQNIIKICNYFNVSIDSVLKYQVIK